MNRGSSALDVFDELPEIALGLILERFEDIFEDMGCHCTVIERFGLDLELLGIRLGEEVLDLLLAREPLTDSDHYDVGVLSGFDDLLALAVRIDQKHRVMFDRPDARQ